MTRAQLIALFPNGNTLHLPSDGPPLPGYELAVARRNAAGSTALAYLDAGSNNEADDTDRTGTQASSSGWLKRIFPGKQPATDVASAAPPPAAATGADDDEGDNDTPDTVASADDSSAGASPRQPRARPILDEDAPIVTASVEPASDTPLVPLPRMRPTVDGDVATSAVSTGQDAIASLTERINQESLPSTEDASDPVALAFAAASEAPAPSEADRAILMAFAQVENSDVVHGADPNLTAALTRRAGDAAPEPPRVHLAAAYVKTPKPARVEPAAQPAAPIVVAEAPESSDVGTVLVAEPVSYDGDESRLMNLIQPAEQAAAVPESPAARNGDLAMPRPASGLYAAPSAASEVADLRGQPSPPVDRFVHIDKPAPQKSFFSKLFASLVE
jgi:hypothetical protein